VKLALDAYSRAVPAHTSGRARHRLAGIETIDLADVSRLAESNLIAQQAPMRAMLVGQAKVWSLNLGTDRASRGWPWQRLAERGVRVVFASDSPAAPVDPMMSLYAAANRLNPGVPDGAPWEPDQKMPLQSAIDAYTRHAAYASFDEQRKGAIAPGMLADMVVLSTDILSLPPERLLDGRVDVTIFDGKVVFQRQAHSLTTN